MQNEEQSTKNVNEIDDLDVDVWSTAQTAQARRRARPNGGESGFKRVEQEAKRVRGKRCQPNDINACLSPAPFSSQLYMWGRHRRLRLPSSLRMCFPSLKVHFRPESAKVVSPTLYYSRYKAQSEEVHAQLFEMEPYAQDNVERSNQCEDTQSTNDSECEGNEEEKNDGTSVVDENQKSVEKLKGNKKTQANENEEQVPTLELLKSLPRSVAAKLIIDACDAPPATVEAFLDILDSVELMVGLHPDQATEPMIDLCLALEIPFAVVPCCIFANIFTHRAMSQGSPPISDPQEYIQYLAAKDSRIKTDTLSCPGSNTVLYFVPDSAKGKAATQMQMKMEGERISSD